MGYKKRLGFKKIAVLAIAIILVLALLFGLAVPLFGSKAPEVPDEQLVKAASAAKYLTVSQEGNIDVEVNYLNPEEGDMDTLTFDIALSTHSIDLAKYEDIRKYLELRTDSRVVINDGFKWDLENSERHHISGRLKIENSIEGKPIVDSDTKSFKLLFKDIGSAGIREHVYKVD